MHTFTVKFWGVRGSVACPGEEYSRYGGNTSCVEVRCDDEVFIFDAGTGIRLLGEHLKKEQCSNITLLLSHTHFDHICGLPFFAPAFDKNSRLKVYAGHLKPHSSLEDTLQKIMAPPFFPISPGRFLANMHYTDFDAGTSWDISPTIHITTTPLNHPDQATAYRIDFKGKSICYVTDTEHFGDTQDPRIVALINNADLVIYDCMYDDHQYQAHQGWGHSTWQEGIRLCEAANAKQLVIFHHDPAHTDIKMDAIAQAAQQRRNGTIVAQEGMRLSLL